MLEEKPRKRFFLFDLINSFFFFRFTWTSYKILRYYLSHSVQLSFLRAPQWPTVIWPLKEKNGFCCKMCRRSYTATINVSIFLLLRLFTAILISWTMISREEEDAHYKESDSKSKRVVQAKLHLFHINLIRKGPLSSSFFFNCWMWPATQGHLLPQWWDTFQGPEKDPHAGPHCAFPMGFNGKRCQDVAIDF